MKIIKIKSGLGNQMFQYAFAKAYRKQTDDGVFIDVSQYGIEHLHNGFELARLFDVDIPVAAKTDVERLATVPDSLLHRVRRKFFTKKTHYIEDEAHFDADVFSLDGDRYLEGYWQSEKYFEAVKAEIRTVFTFVPPPNPRSAGLLETIDRRTAALHVRRGDYLLAMNSSLNICTKEYYNRAVQKLAAAKEISRFIVFSDDIAWCKENLKLPEGSALFADWNTGSDSWQDMLLMSRCGSLILSNSSFSWWSAYLNTTPDLTVYAPSVWNRAFTSDVPRIPSSWELLPV